MAECGWNLPQTREVCSRDSEEVWDDGLQAMTTPIASNLKLLSDASSEVVDATMHRQMIGSLMYPRPDICFAVKTFETCSPDGCKACRGIIHYRLKYNEN